MTNKTTGGSVFGVIITIVVIVLVARCMFCDDEPAGSPSKAAQGPEHDSVTAWVNCQEFVKRRLKAPASADFGGVLSGDWQDPDTHAVHKGGGVYECNGWVDAQNSFGAQIRNQFSLIVKHVGGDRWELVDGPVIQ